MAHKLDIADFGELAPSSGGGLSIRTMSDLFYGFRGSSLPQFCAGVYQSTDRGGGPSMARALRLIPALRRADQATRRTHFRHSL